MEHIHKFTEKENKTIKEVKSRSGSENSGSESGGSESGKA